MITTLHLKQAPSVWARKFGALLLLLAAVAGAGQAVRADFQGATHLTPFDEDALNYSNTAAAGPVTALQRRIDSGEVKLNYDPALGYLPSVLRELGIPQSSQMLVFSKTSLQRERISPQTPRAIFFGDDAYIGFIPGAPLIEVSAVDPKLGGVFYTLHQEKVERPKFLRNNQCLECHASGKSMGVPGHLVRSFATDESGVADITSGTSQVNHRTLFEERWGGWYVTGTHGPQLHRGNLVGKDAFARQISEPNYLGNLTNLSRFFEVTRYPEKSSDVVALMVLEHQTHMHNFITRLSYEATLALQRHGHLRYLKGVAEAFLKYLLFVEEAPLTHRIQGSSSFVKDFSAGGPRDSAGRSLRDLNLETRLFQHPCSYVIYSDAFEAIPGPMKEHLYRRLWEILSEEDTSAAFANLSSESRKRVREILIETKTGLPDYWKASSGPAATSR